MSALRFFDPRREVNHRHGGRLSHAIADDADRSVCGKFSREELDPTRPDDYAVCARCRTLDPRASRQSAVPTTARPDSRPLSLEGPKTGDTNE